MRRNKGCQEKTALPSKPSNNAGVNPHPRNPSRSQWTRSTTNHLSQQASRHILAPRKPFNNKAPTNCNIPPLPCLHPQEEKRPSKKQEMRPSRREKYLKKGRDPQRKKDTLMKRTGCRPWNDTAEERVTDNKGHWCQKQRGQQNGRGHRNQCKKQTKMEDTSDQQN